MDIKKAAKAYLAGLMIAGFTYFNTWVEAKIGVSAPVETISSVGNYVADAAVSIVAGLIGGWITWRIPNA